MGGGLGPLNLCAIGYTYVLYKYLYYWFCNLQVVGKVDDNTSVIDENVAAEKSDNAFVIHILVLLLTCLDNKT